MSGSEIFWYRYEPADCKRVCSLSQDKLFISDPEKFNDPFDISDEMLQRPDGNVEKSSDWRRLESTFLNGSLTEASLWTSPLFPNKFEELVSDVQSETELGGWPSLAGAIRENLQSFGVQCFSRDWRIPLCWAHYSSACKGFVIEYEAQELTIAGGNLGSCHFHDVAYTSEPLSIGLAECLAVPNATLRRLLATKSPVWAYEKEVRLVHYKIKGDFAAMPAGLSIKSLIAGSHADKPMLQILREKAESLKVELYQVKMKHDGSFTKKLVD
ncbi:DUF2971 domain-containing protein [Shewanella litorisediminis]|uniref:DUF2971 domain-containing protein n=1 Tax=Shewanella litorisediminis TaxID=1173586 RepID=A0ABX7G4M2_9GAMM|nr:DUF2971 domain-containing protein [Shewanella litorisediminis]MCL2917750.1 DUF2971 domain-containing protein [Shewanella litorisediminis]QRH02195.1 DUF2971 domain-containing protein [Shewanella litorisediminis]